MLVVYQRVPWQIVLVFLYVFSSKMVCGEVFFHGNCACSRTFTSDFFSKSVVLLMLFLDLSIPFVEVFFQPFQIWHLVLLFLADFPQYCGSHICIPRNAQLLMKNQSVWQLPCTQVQLYRNIRWLCDNTHQVLQSSPSSVTGVLLCVLCHNDT